MKHVVLAAIAAAALSASSALAADLPVKAAPAAAPASPFDIAFGSALTSDYLFRGVTQSNHKPSVNAYFEPRYNINADNQLYVGLAGNSISFPNRAAAEIDVYGGWRPTIGKLALDFGGWYYGYPGGQTFTGFGTSCTNLAADPTGTICNSMKGNVSFFEAYAKANYNITDAFVVGAAFNYSPSVLNSGAKGYYYNGNAKYTFNALGNGVTPYVSGEVGYWSLGTTDAFYGPVTYKSYTHWDAGFGWSYKVFTVDLRYSGTNLSKGDCNGFTGDHTVSTGGAVTASNPNGGSSNWCDQRFFATLKADLTANTNLK